MEFFVRNKDPDGITDLLQWIFEDPDLAEINFAARCNGRDILANSVGAKLPPVVTVLQSMPFEPTFRKWHSAMRTVITQSKGFPV